ncbi:MAG: FixH family protein [Betaproteobacteria bacterium]
MNAGGSENVVPWYRERWPWLLMAGPAIVVVAGLATAWIAVVHQDPLVVDDYYKQGLAINRTLARQEAAARLGIVAELQFSDRGDSIRALLKSDAGAPDTLLLHLAHGTRAELDQTVTLEHVSGGWYEAKLAPIVSGGWTLILEDPANGWRVAGSWYPATERSIRLEPAVR